VTAPRRGRRRGLEILFLTPEFLFPARSGGTIKSLALLEHLRRRHRLRVACFTRRLLDPEQERWTEEVGDVRTLLLDRGRTPLNLLRSYLHGIPLSIERNRSGTMAALISGVVEDGPPDAIFVDGWLMAQYVPASFAGLKLLHQHNAEHLMWRRQIALERNPTRRALLRAEYRRVREYEASILGRFDAVFAVSDPDRRALVALGADPERILPLPNVADPELLSRPAPSRDSGRPVLLFLGTLTWEPNVAGLELFLRTAFPRLRERVPEARLLIAGQGKPPATLTRLAEEQGAELVEAVGDPEPLYRASSVFVDPSRGGAGGRVKILNAMARGLPVVATPDAAGGLDVISGKHLLVCDTPEATAEAIRDLLADRERWLSLSRAGRELVRRRYVPARAFGALDEVLATVRAGSSAD
jgi:glycosyltransferase involved in cell wall biosynthesis